MLLIIINNKLINLNRMLDTGWLALVSFLKCYMKDREG